jgi:O-antigen/teichoic acid export membrane protein
VIVLDRLGAQEAAYYFVAFQIAALLYAAIYAVESAFFAEGSQAGIDWRSIRRRSRRLAITLFVPAGLVLALGSRWIMLAFGVKYSINASASLELLAAAVVPLALCSWSWTVLKLSGRLGVLVASNATYAAGVCGGAWLLASHGLTAVSSAWFVGATLGAVVAAVPASLASRKSPARHRRIVPNRPTPQV